jgi:hypothetical protein
VLDPDPDEMNADPQPWWQAGRHQPPAFNSAMRSISMRSPPLSPTKLHQPTSPHKVGKVGGGECFIFIHAMFCVKQLCADVQFKLYDEKGMKN